MRHTFLSIAGAATLAAGMMFAQTAPPPPAQPGTAPMHQRRAQARANMFQRLSTDLNLTPAQQTQAKTIFSNMHQQSQPVMQQLHQQRQALANAVKSNAPASQIDQLANQMGPLESQLAAIHAKSFEQFRGILTPEQTAKLDSMTAAHMGREFGQFKGSTGTAGRTAPQGQ